MARVDARVQLDDEVLRAVDAVAERFGSSREAVLEDSVRRGLAARTLEEVFAAVRSRGALAADGAEQLAHEEVRAARAARRSSTRNSDAS